MQWAAGKRRRVYFGAAKRAVGSIWAHQIFLTLSSDSDAPESTHELWIRDARDELERPATVRAALDLDSEDSLQSLRPTHRDVPTPCRPPSSPLRGRAQSPSAADEQSQCSSLQCWHQV
jgi:hypothetical protein